MFEEMKFHGRAFDEFEIVRNSRLGGPFGAIFDYYSTRVENLSNIIAGT